jgi:protein CpxP
MNRKAFPATMSFLLAATLAAAPLAFAQAPQQPMPDAQAPSSTAAHTPNPHRQAMRIARQLNLTPDQTGKIEPILADRDQKIASLRADNTLSPQAARQQMRQIQQNTTSQLSNVLSPDQLNHLKSMQHTHGHPAQSQSPTSPSA